MTSSKTVAGIIAVAMAFANAADIEAQSLTRRLTARLDSTPLNRHVWGVAILDRGDRVIYSRNAERLFMPASNTKLLVTSVAARRLPPGWVTTTSVYSDGTLANGVLAGDLVLYGRGDPTWTRRCYGLEPTPPAACEPTSDSRLRQLAGAVRQKGITVVAGAVIGDGSYFEPVLTHPTWEQDDLVWGYAAPISGLGYNENLVVATVVAGAGPGDAPTVALDPDIGGLTIENRARTVASTERADLSWRRSEDGRHAVLTGTIPVGDSDRSSLAVVDPNRFAALAFLRALADSGITVKGGVWATTDSTTTAPARRAEPLASVVSRPVEDWIFAILNVSQNWFAETLLKHLGRQFGTEASWSEGIRVERRFLIDSMRLDSTQFFPHDGSGLSSKNLASPMTFATILASMRRHKRYPAFAAGMPRSGATGSLRNRFLTTPVMHLVRAKTGSIGQVNTLSGYLDTDSTLAARPRPCRTFSVQANHHTLGGRTMIQAIDSVVVEIARGTPCAKVPPGAAEPISLSPSSPRSAREDLHPHR